MRGADLRLAGRGLTAAARLAVRRSRGHLNPWEPGFDHGPRPCPPGLVCGPPDFVGVGTQRSGTTWWFSLLAGHPDLYHHAAYHKERHFLAALGTDGEPRQQDLSAYSTWFPRPVGRMTGEWTPDYAYYHWVPPLLARAAPAAKLLLLLRDPVERYRSGVGHAAVNGSAGSANAAQEAFSRGLYADQLDHLERHFPPEQILVLQYERCRADPSAQLARTFRFLGVDDGFVPEAARRPAGGGGRNPALHPDHRRQLQELYQPDVAALVDRRPEVDPALWPNFTSG